MDAMEIRRNAIVELVNKYGTVSFSQIKEQFSNVSEMTLRTDLKALDEAKEIVRIHGGAKSVQLVIGTDDYAKCQAKILCHQWPAPPLCHSHSYGQS